jgi:hypothetical protein
METGEGGLALRNDTAFHVLHCYLKEQIQGLLANKREQQIQELLTNKRN